ncbi:MAG: glutathione S-transferase [Hyphomicrobiales bacterium]|nr:MAG: glutathione S-transferase [Hyphomicrobiales bacterium]
MYRILTGDKAYSSWSLRGWLLLAAFDLPFEDVPVRMYDPAFDARQAANAPARSVPQIEWNEGGETRRVWDTMAIAETLAERHPRAGIWPTDPNHRAIARSLAAEMHSSFRALRGACPMNLHRPPGPMKRVAEDVAADVARIGQLWSWALAQTGGPWLGGPAFSAVDAFYAPVAFRLLEYALSAPGTDAYADGLRAHPTVARWVQMAKDDPRRLPHYDVD